MEEKIIIQVPVHVPNIPGLKDASILAFVEIGDGIVDVWLGGYPGQLAELGRFTLMAQNGELLLKVCHGQEQTWQELKLAKYRPAEDDEGYPTFVVEKS